MPHTAVHENVTSSQLVKKFKHETSLQYSQEHATERTFMSLNDTLLCNTSCNSQIETMAKQTESQGVVGSELPCLAQLVSLLLRNVNTKYN
jgi:hypothetical protein